MAKINKYLELDSGQYAVLLNLQKTLVLNDIFLTATRSEELSQKKQKWLKEWLLSIESFKKLRFVSNLTEREIADFLLKQPYYVQQLILLEAYTFVPYFPLSERGSGVPKKEAYTQQFRDQWEARFMAFLLLLNFDIEGFKVMKNVYAEALKSIPGTDWKSISRSLTIIAGASAILGVTGGVAAPWVGGLIGSSLMGLSGAAATSAGLAFLGGGALAAGGLGMAGGTAFLVGGGALLGSLIGKSYSNNQGNDIQLDLIAFDSNFLISQSAKVETIVRTSVSVEDRDEVIRDVLKNYRENLDKLVDLIKLGAGLKEKFPKLQLETIERNKRIIENSIKRICESYDLI